MAQLTVPVTAPGATQAAADINKTAGAADKLAVSETKVSASTKRLKTDLHDLDQTAKRTDATLAKIASRTIGRITGLGGGTLGRSSMALGAGGVGGLAIGGLVVGAAVASIGLKLLERSAARAEESINRLGNISKATTDAFEKVKSTQEKQAAGNAESVRVTRAGLIARGTSAASIAKLDENGVQALGKTRGDQSAHIAAAEAAAKLSGGRFTVNDFVGEHGNDPQSLLARKLGVGVGSLPDALNRLKSDQLSGDVGMAANFSQGQSAANMNNRNMINMGNAAKRIEESPLGASMKALQEASDAETKRLEARAEAEGALLRIWRNTLSIIGGEGSARGALTRANEDLGLTPK